MKKDTEQERTTLTGEEASQGRIVLDTTFKRVVFFSAFVMLGLLGLSLMFLAGG